MLKVGAILLTDLDKQRTLMKKLGREHVRDILPTFNDSLGALDVKIYDRKVTEQKEIVQHEIDVKILRKAFTAFTSLQHVQVLRVQDREDEILINHLRRHEELAQHVQLKWDPACSHSTTTLGAAILSSHSPCSRFSSPMLSPQSAQLAGHVLALSPVESKTLAQKLTSLELHFDDGHDLDRKMMELSSMFKVVVMTAINMQAIHVGFPSHRPISLRLDEIFHGVKWRKLSAFGIQAWKLDADEIIELVLRHRERLRGLRLRDVLLKEKSMWKDILGVLRDDMPRLDWVSLRRIGYASHFDEQWEGVEVPDDLPGGASDSDEDSIYDEADDDGHEHAPSTREIDSEPDGSDLNSDPEPDPDDDDNNDSNEDDDISSTDSNASEEEEEEEEEEEHGPRAHEMNFPLLPPDTPTSQPWCTCGECERHFGSAEQLGDDGILVSNAQRKVWEQWVVYRCAEHPALPVKQG